MSGPAARNERPQVAEPTELQVGASGTSGTGLSGRTSTSSDSVGHDGVLLDEEVVSDYPSQALLLSLLATLVRNTSDENEQRVLYMYLAEASTVFRQVFPVIHSLLDSKINHVLQYCHDAVILSCVQFIIQNMISVSDLNDSQQQQQQLTYLQSIGYGGLWRFSGVFSDF